MLNHGNATSQRMTSFLSNLFILITILFLNYSVALAGDIEVELTTSDGSTKFEVEDSGGNDVFTVDSDGNTAWPLTATVSDLTVPTTTATPNGAITAPEGSLAYDTTGNTLYYNTDSGTTWTAVGVGAGDITDVFNCSSGDCASITISATDLLNLSGSDASTTTEGLILPQHATACAGGTAEGQVCWEADDNALYIGNGTSLTLIGSSGGAFSDSADPIVQNTTSKDVQIGDGAGTLTAKLEIGGDADQPQLVVEGHSTQTDSLAIFQNDADTEVATVDVSGLITTLVGIDAIGAVDLDIGSADVTDVTLTTDGGTIILDGNITQDAGTTLFMGGLLDATGAVDMDYGSADITDHTFTSDGGTVVLDGTITSSGDVTVSGGEVILGSTTQDGTLVIHDDDVGGDATVTIQAADATGTSYTLTLPPDDGDAGEQLQTNGSGVLTWESAGSSGGAFSDSADPIVQNTTSKDVQIGDGAGTLTAKLEIGGDADQPQLVVEGHSTQTDSLAIFQNDADTEVATVDVSGLITTLVGIDAIGAVDLDIGSADVTDVTLTTDGGTIILDGNITQDAGTTLFMGGLLDATGAVDMDYGSVDITDHTFITDGTGTTEIVLPAGSIDSTEILDGTIAEDDLAASLVFDDGDLLNLGSISITSTTEGLILPQHATDCSTAGTAEGQVCWEADANTLYIGNGATVTQIGSGSGDITDVFSCASGDCASITMAATDLLNMSGTDASTTTEGLILPQHATACAGGTAEGQVCWEADANILHIGDAATIVDFVPTSAFSGDATVSTTGVVTVVDDSHAHVIANIDSMTSAALAGQISDETGTGVAVFATAPSFTTSITSTLVITDLIDTTGAADIDIGSADVTDVTLTTDGGTIILDGNITQDAGTTLFMGGLLDATGAVDMDYGSVDITDHTFITDGTGTTEIVLPAGSIDSTEILDGTIAEDDLAASLVFDDGDLLNLSAISINGTAEGLILPQHATDCSTAGTAEGQVCWEADANTLYIGNGATVTQIGAGVSDLDTAYNGGNTIDVDGSAVTLTVSDTDNNEALSVVQADTTNNPIAMSISNSGTGDELQLISTNAAADGPNLVLHHNSVSPADADVVATIDFDGEDDGGNQTTYASIQALANDVTGGTEDGELVFSTMVGASLTEAMRIDESGNVGIGTDTPTTRLQIGPGTVAIGALPDEYALVVSDTNGNESGLVLYIADGGNQRTSKFFLDDSTGITGIDSTAAVTKPDFQIRSNGNVQLHIDDSDSGSKVGIGTTSPGGRLEVEVDNAENLAAILIDNDDITNDTPGLQITMAETGGAPLQIDPLSAAPTTTAEGSIYYDSDDDKLYVYANGGFVDLTVQGGAFDSTAVDDTTWSDNANASNTWTFDVSGTDHTAIFGSALTTWSGGITTTLDLIVNGQDITLGATGVKFTSDNDGALTILGLGDGSDEDLTINLDDTSNQAVLSSSTGLTTIDFGSIGADYDSATVTLSTVSGAVDAGSATSVEIPNGTGPTVDVAGEVAIDTTGDDIIYFGAAKRSISYKQFKSFTLESPSDDDNLLLFKAPYALTITDIECLCDPADAPGESVVIDIQERDSTADNPATVDATITCDDDGASDDGALSNGTIDSGDWVSIDIGTVTGTVTQVSVTLTYTKDAE